MGNSVFAVRSYSNGIGDRIRYVCFDRLCVITRIRVCFAVLQLPTGLLHAVSRNVHHFNLYLLTTSKYDLELNIWVLVKTQISNKYWPSRVVRVRVRYHLLRVKELKEAGTTLWLQSGRCTPACLGALAAALLANSTPTRPSLILA